MFRSLARYLVFLSIACPRNGVLCFAVESRRTRLPPAGSLQRQPRTFPPKETIKKTSPVLGHSKERIGVGTALLASVAASDGQDEGQYLRGGATLASAVKKWPCRDELDKQLVKIAVPCILNFAIAPLVGAVDLFWVNQMGNPLAVAGQAAANQVFNSVFWLASFLPSGEPDSCLEQQRACLSL